MSRSKSTSRSSKKRTPEPPPPTWDERAIGALLPYRIEIGGGLLFFVGAFLFLNFLTLPKATCGNSELKSWLCIFNEGFGWGAYPLFLTLMLGGLYLALRRIDHPYHPRPRQIIGLELILLAALPLSHWLTGTTLATAYLGRGGGLVGWALAEPLLSFLGPFLTSLFYLAILAWSISLITGFNGGDMQRGLQRLSQRLRAFAQQVAPTPAPPAPTEATPAPAAPASPTAEAAAPVDHTAVSSPPRVRRRPALLPPLSLLQKGGAAPLSDAEIEAKKQKIVATLADFGLPAQVTEIRRGPAVTQFGVQPGYVEKTGRDGEVKQHKVRVGQIASLQKDLALALAVPRLRVQAPVPGRGVVGVEVPNTKTAVVRLRAVLTSDAFYRLNQPLAVALGLDVSGAPVAVDLGKMPHLLIAGTTGSGKSVCINALISCLVFNNPPDRLNLIMIDPKKVELIRFNGLPHLIGRVETEADRAVGVLRWLTAEMDRRYELFAREGARNLSGYNRKMGKDEEKKIPYLAVFIDELADLMNIYPGDVERTLCRLAQMARATGIHLVVATQRPSTDVITGLIKANFPARLSFAVTSGTDSRVILDGVGAEHLLGKGDMLFLGPDASAPQRIQGVFVSDPEIEGIVKHWRHSLPDWEPIPCPWETLIARHALLDETDSMLEQAIELVQKRDTISTSYLQRRLRIGFPRAARIMEHLYEMGLVEDPKSGGKTRKTYVEEDDNPLEDLISDQSPET